MIRIRRGQYGLRRTPAHISCSWGDVRLCGLESRVLVASARGIPRLRRIWRAMEVSVRALYLYPQNGRYVYVLQSVLTLTSSCSATDPPTCSTLSVARRAKEGSVRRPTCLAALRGGRIGGLKLPVPCTCMLHPETRRSSRHAAALVVLRPTIATYRYQYPHCHASPGLPT